MEDDTKKLFKKFRTKELRIFCWGVTCLKEGIRKVK